MVHGFRHSQDRESCHSARLRHVWLFTEDGNAGAEADDMTLIATVSGVSDAASFDDGDFTTF